MRGKKKDNSQGGEFDTNTFQLSFRETKYRPYDFEIEN